MKNFKASIHVRQSTTLKFCKARTIPFALEEVVKSESKTKLENEGASNRLQKRISKDIIIRKRDSWKKYCDDMELSEGQDAAWCKIRSVLNPKSAAYNYPTLVSRDKGGGGDKDQISDNIREIGHLRFPVGSGLHQRNRELCF